MTGRFRFALCSGAMLLALGPVGALAQPAAPAPSQAVVTPRTPDGHPDLNGVISQGVTNPKYFDEQTDTGSNNVPARNGRMANFENDNALTGRAGRNKPQYRPQFWDAVREADWNGNQIDPVPHCKPSGVPREGTPVQIIEKDNKMVMIYASVTAVGSPRIFWIDGRPHDPEKVSQETWNGDSVGHWEGDTLVIDTIGFTDESWLGSGYIHGYKMQVTERLTRKGNDLLYEVTVDDPEYFAQPWVKYPRTIHYSTDPDAAWEEPLPCDSRDVTEMVGHNRNGGSGPDPGPHHLFGMVVPAVAKAPTTNKYIEGAAAAAARLSN